MGRLTDCFSLLVAIAGWYYMFYSRAAEKLGAIEEQQINQKRSRLRRIGGFVMFLLAVFLFAGVHTVDEKSTPVGFLSVWLMVFLLLFLIVVLALVDVRLTARLRRRRHLNPPS
jgi:UDP-N-acetylmuramyl pentapeptide phosphotransferase/UDP-N-acetylglucosamine-1-phosphate transferase